MSAVYSQGNGLTSPSHDMYNLIYYRYVYIHIHTLHLLKYEHNNATPLIETTIWEVMRYDNLSTPPCIISNIKTSIEGYYYTTNISNLNKSGFRCND